MRTLILSLTTLVVLSGVVSIPAHAQMQGSLLLDQRPGLTSDLQDPEVELQRIRQRRQIAREPADALFRTSPLTPVRECFIDFEKRHQHCRLLA